MPRPLEITAAALFLLLSASLLTLWSFLTPSMWTVLDVRMALASLALTWLGVAWALSQGRPLADPEPM